MRLARIALSFLAIALVLARLSISYEDNIRSVRAATAGALQADDQSVTIQLPGEPITLDPQRSEFEQDIAVEHLLFRGLFTFDVTANPVPALAAEVPTRENGGVSSDGLTYTIALRPGQTFSDGAPLTARDVVYSIQRLLDPALASPYTGFFYDIAGAQAFNTALGTSAQPRRTTPEELSTLRAAVGVTALDDQTVQFSLIRPSGSFLARLALWSAVPVERAVIERYGDAWTNPG